jgi:ribosomal protein S4
MRLISKYKIYTKSSIIPTKFCLRILKFNRPKWKRLQKNLIRTSKKKPRFIRQLAIKTRLKSWSRVKSKYKSGLNTKNAISTLFDNSISKKLLKKNLFFYKKAEVDNVFRTAIVKPQFRIDILLSNLNLFFTSYQARQSINSGLILVNNKRISNNYFLKKGDMISFKKISVSHFFSLKTFFSYHSKSDYLASFLEIDHYTKTIIILKDYVQLGEEDFFLTVSNSFDLKLLKDYLQ